MSAERPAEGDEPHGALSGDAAAGLARAVLRFHRTLRTTRLPVRKLSAAAERLSTAVGLAEAAPARFSAAELRSAGGSLASATAAGTLLFAAHDETLPRLRAALPASPAAASAAAGAVGGALHGAASAALLAAWRGDARRKALRFHARRAASAALRDGAEWATAFGALSFLSARLAGEAGRGKELSWEAALSLAAAAAGAGAAQVAASQLLSEGAVSPRAALRAMPSACLGLVAYELATRGPAD